MHHKLRVAGGVVDGRRQNARVAKDLFHFKHTLANDQLQTNVGRITVRNIHAVFP